MNTTIVAEPWFEYVTLLPVLEEKTVDVPQILTRAELMIQADYLEQALEELNLAIEAQPANTYALFMRYCCKLKLGLWTEADEDLLLVNQLNAPPVEEPAKEYTMPEPNVEHLDFLSHE